MKSFFVDLHIHLGATATGKPVKITASKQLTLVNVLQQSSAVKGLDLIAIIDCHVPEVLLEIEGLLLAGELIELADGGLCYQEKITFLLGSELEIYDAKCRGPIHVLAYFPYLDDMKSFSSWLAKRVTNRTLSSQRIYEEALFLQRKVKELCGLFIPAHVFTPFKSLYGKGVEKSLTEVFDPAMIDGIELGLSADTYMAEKIEELAAYPFLTNSDAHSIATIAREYQEIKLEKPSFAELKLALAEKAGRCIERNFGLNPLLGKYYQSTCRRCYTPVNEATLTPCSTCGHQQIVKGVATRISELAGGEFAKKQRPPYLHQIPLQFIPGLGAKTLEKLKKQFGTEMNIIHNVAQEQLEAIVSKHVAQCIVRGRTGELTFQTGGGGKYGRIIT